MVDNVEKKFISDLNVISNLDRNKSEIIVYNDMTITLSSYDTQKNIEKNMTSIYLGKCKDILLKKNKNLYIERIEANIKGYDIPVITFRVYTKKNDNNLVKLNLSICNNEKVEFYIPVNVPINLDKVNLSSGYFNDICYPATSDKGTDIIRKDRIKDFVENNKTRCQNDCVFSKYIEEYKKAKCTCDIKELFTSFGDININKTKFYENYINIRNIANINILICYKVLFSKKGLKNNYVSYSISAIIIFHLFCIILYYAKYMFNQLISIIKHISYGIKNRVLIFKKKVTVIAIQNKKNRTNYKNKDKAKINIKNNNFIPNLFSSNRYLENNNKLLLIRKNNYRLKSYKNSSMRTLNINKLRKPRFISNKSKNSMEYNYAELNNLPYNLALQKDKRTYCQYYFSLLRVKHFLIFIFCNDRDYNIKIIKIILFFFVFLYI